MKFILGRYRRKDTTVRDSPIVRNILGSDLISPVFGVYRKRSSPVGRKQLIRTSRRTGERSNLFIVGRCGRQIYRWDARESVCFRINIKECKRLMNVNEIQIFKIMIVICHCPIVNMVFINPSISDRKTCEARSCTKWPSETFILGSMHSVVLCLRSRTAK